MHSGTAINLKYQHDHIEDSVLVYSPSECVIYLIANEKEHPGSFVKLSFEGARCIRSTRTDCSPAIGIYPKEAGICFVVELTSSQWPGEAYKSFTYANSGLKPRGRHFVVSNNDIFHEVLADSFEESIVIPSSEEHERVRLYFPSYYCGEA